MIVDQQLEKFKAHYKDKSFNAGHSDKKSKLSRMSTFRSHRSNSETYYTNQASDKKLLGSLLDNGQTQLMSEIYRQR